MTGDEPIDKSMRRKLHKLHGKLRKTIHTMGNPAKKALDHKSGKIQKKPTRYLSASEQKEKTKNWPKSSPSSLPTLKKSMGMKKFTHDYQAKHKRAYND